MRASTGPGRGTAAFGAWTLAAVAVGGVPAASISALLWPVGETGRAEALWVLSWPGFRSWVP